MVTEVENWKGGEGEFLQYGVKCIYQDCVNS